MGPSDRPRQPVSDPIQDRVGLVLGFVFRHAGYMGPNLTVRSLNGLRLQLYIHKGLARSERKMVAVFCKQAVMGLFAGYGLENQGH